jgi:two-component system, NtrC family, nitrogen regulation response regulator NtrX
MSKKRNVVGAKKILIVDDEPDIVALYSKALKDVGYQVTESRDGVQAMFKIRNSNFDLIITDIKMPRLTGDQMLLSLLAHKNIKPQQPIIIFSGFVDLQLVNKFKKQAHIRLLTKPTTAKTLLEEVRKLLRD